MTKWLKEEVISYFGFNAIIIERSKQKMEQEEKKLLLILLVKDMIQKKVLIKVEILQVSNK